MQTSPNSTGPHPERMSAETGAGGLSRLGLLGAETRGGLFQVGKSIVAIPEQTNLETRALGKGNIEVVGMIARLHH